MSELFHVADEKIFMCYNKDHRCVCYESHLFDSWSYAAGFVVQGKNKGKPNTIQSIQTNSLCVLTTLLPDAKEDDRNIFGVFIVVRGEVGDDMTEGKVIGHSKYRLTLTEEESNQMLFWKYYKNANAKEKKAWGTGLFRYLNDDICEKILEDIVKIKAGKPDEQLAKELLTYYKNKA